MKDKLASTGGALLLIGAAMMDSDNIAIPLAIMAISFALIGAAAYLEWKEEHNERIICRSVAGHKEKEILR